MHIAITGEAKARKEYKAAWYRKHKAKVKKTQAAWHKQHPTYKKQYQEINVFTVRSYAAEWREAHRGHLREYNARYYREKTLAKRKAARVPTGEE